MVLPNSSLKAILYLITNWGNKRHWRRWPFRGRDDRQRTPRDSQIGAYEDGSGNAQRPSVATSFHLLKSHRRLCKLHFWEKPRDCDEIGRAAGSNRPPGLWDHQLAQPKGPGVTAHWRNQKKRCGWHGCLCSCTWKDSLWQGKEVTKNKCKVNEVIVVHWGGDDQQGTSFEWSHQGHLHPDHVCIDCFTKRNINRLSRSTWYIHSSSKEQERLFIW